jgi:hypothetical protein
MIKFKVKINGQQLFLKRISIPKGFKETENLVNEDASIYWVWYLYPFVKIGLFIRKKWFKLGYWFYERGFLKKYKQGEYKSWFWLKYL